MYSNYKMQGDDPPFLPVGTEVSAKYKGAFCEAKIKKVVRNIKCKVTLKAGGITTVNDDVIKGTLRVGNTVEVKQDPKKDAMEAVITKIQDCSQYTVVFDDGDITTLRRSALCLKSGRHFNESETLDQLPLTHPEHFSTPVIAGRRGRRGRAQSEESEGETSSASGSRRAADSEPNVGRVVLVEAAGPAERRRPHQPAFPALVVAPTPQIKVKEDYLVRSFKDGRYYTVPKKEAREFRRGSAPLEWSGVEAALQYLNNGVLPPHWDRDSIFNEPRNTSDDSSDDEPREEKDHFVAQLYKFMDDRGTPLNRNPTIANKDIDLYRLFRVVQKNGGYNRVTNQNQWKTIADKMGFHPVTTSITNLCKQAYKKFLHSFEDFYRKLGVTLVAHPRGARTPPAGRSLIRDRDRQPPPASASPTSSPAAVTATPAVTQRTKEKESDKSETDKSDKSEKEDKVEKTEKMKEKPRASDEDDSADNQPLAATTPKVDKEKDKDKDKDKEKDKDKDKEKEKDKMTTPAEEKVSVPRSQSKTRSLPPVKTEPIEKRTPKRKIMSSKVGESAGGGGGGGGGGRASRRPHVSTDSDSSGRASRCGLAKKMVSRRSQSANSASSGNTVASGGSKRPRNRKSTDRPCAEPTRSGGAAVKAQVGDKLKVYYGPTQSESKVTYEAKVIEVSAEGTLRVHYTGWNTRYDEWIRPQRIALNVTQHDARNKKGTNVNRRVRSKRAEESSARSDTDSSDTDEDDKKKLDEKTRAKPPLRSKEAKPNEGNNSSRPRKRPARTISTTSTSSTPASAPKKPRITETSHKGRDYDLNEIRSELKGLQTVKQEAEENVKTESTQKESTPSPTQVSANTETPPSAPVEKQAEDVYEFKEPEPFELELHDEKKKRSHRIFDDISPSKYTSAMSKSLSEEISEDAIRRPTSFRSPSLSPFREFGVTRDVAERQSPEDNSKDGLFSLDDDSLPGEGSSGPIFEGFTPAKNQETYSKKNKVNKLRELIDDSPDSPADDEQSSEEESDEVIKMDQRELSPEVPPPEVPKSPEPIKEDEEEKETDTAKAINEAILSLKDIPPIEEIPEPPKTPPPSRKELVKREISEPTNMEIDEEVNMEPIKVETIPLPSTEPIVEKPEANDPPIEKVEKAIITKIEPPSSPLIDTEEDKSEPDSPARIDVLPVPPPGFLLQSEGPKIAEKLLKAINSAKILSMSPTPTDERPETPKIEIKPVEESIPVTIEQNIVPKPELLKPPTKLDPIKRLSPAEVRESIFGEPSKISDMKHELADIKKVKPKETSPPRLQSPLSILERRKSIADLQLPTPGKNKVLSDTIQKLSSQINQPVAAVSIPIPTFPPADRSDSSDSDDSDQRLIIDKLSVEEWGSGSGGSGSGSLGAGARALHASKSPGEWSAGESLLMLEDACKNERKHSASVVVAGGTRSAVAAACAAAGTGAAAGVGAVAGAGEEDSNLSLLLCEETIPGSPAPDPEPAPPAHHMPFACAPPHHSHTKGEDRHGANPGRERESGSVGVTVGGPGAADAARGAAEGGWGRRRALLAHTPPTASTTPDSSLDLSPHRERRMSERDSPSERKEDEDDTHMQDACAHVGGRSRKASESGAGRTRSRRRRDTDDQPPPPATPPLKYNFYVDLDPSWDSVTRINILTNQMAALRKTYSAVRAELAAIDRRRKKLRRKEREAIKAAKASCS